MSRLVPNRVHRAEIMDLEGNSAADLAGALRDIRWTNRWLGGRSNLLAAVEPFLAPVGGMDADALELLDVGTGEADLPRVIVDRCRRLGRAVRVTALDRDPGTAAIARAACAAYPEIVVVCADAFRAPFPPGRFDLVTASLFLHHFAHADVVRLLRRFRELARRAVIVNDLERHRLPWAFIWLASRASLRHPMYRHDAPLSVLRGFTAEELRRAALESGVDGPAVESCWPFRLRMTLPGSRAS